MATRQKEKSPSHLHSHKILATYTISYTSCEATLATSHTWKKKKGWWTLCKDPFQGAIHPESQIIYLTRRVGS
jgi:hypothetical protein